MSVNTEVSVADWILNGGFSISGYDIAETNWAIEQKLEIQQELKRLRLQDNISPKVNALSTEGIYFNCTNVI